MSKYKHCFVLENNHYVEVPYETLITGGKKSTTYENRYFIPLHGSLMEVSQKDYREFYRKKRRQKYLLEEAISHNEISYHALDTDELSGEETIVDTTLSPTDELVVHKVMIENLREALKLLTEDEMELITALFYSEHTLRQWSTKTGIPVMTIQDRKTKIIEKLKKLIKI